MAECCWLCCVFLFALHFHRHTIHCQHVHNEDNSSWSPATEFPVKTRDAAAIGQPASNDCPLCDLSVEGECLHKLFNKYGTENGMMDIDGFEHLLTSIGLLGDHHHHHDHEDDHVSGEDHIDVKKRTSFEQTAGNLPIHEDAPFTLDAGDFRDENAGRYTSESATNNNQQMSRILRKRKSVNSDLSMNRVEDSRDTFQNKRMFAKTNDKKDIPSFVSHIREERGIVPSDKQDESHSEDESAEDDDHREGDDHEHDEDQEKHLICKTPESYFENFGKKVGDKVELDFQAFYSVCPILIHQLDNSACEHEDEHDHGHDDNEFLDETATSSLTKTPAAVWGYGFLSITIISLTSLAGILIVPIFKRFPEFYKQLLSLLVALAVGTLAGDAVLHLIPHSFGLHAHGEDNGHNHHGDEHDDQKVSDVVMRGLVILLGIYFFFMTERLMHIFSDQRKRNSRREAIKAQIEEQQHAVGERLSDPNRKSQFIESSPMITSSPISEQGVDEKRRAVNNGGTFAPTAGTKENFQRKSSEQFHHSDVLHGNHSHHGDEEEPYMHSHGDDDDDDEHHHHHHHHGPEVGDGIASVAWMVIMGDGLHNFSDGLAVGAAFADNLTGGISTSIAIFCHELPHELGDFAILLSSGMSVRQAVIYSLLSSLLSYIGLFIGIGLSNIEAASLWIFALAGGMFLYIALVDMLPEMMHTHSKTGHKLWCHLLLQNIGLLTGVALMFLIAVFEDKLLTTLQ
ncbi:zinc transporter ZIP10-like [Ptychodera flava]|uniref:zinc transporter ZIP10-like n=1 Tax=Ptychodera flava TaxID=63121 RepID=UPI003969BFC4